MVTGVFGSFGRVHCVRAFRGLVNGAPLFSVVDMRGADEGSIMEQWKRLADRESDKQWRSDYAGLALVFADLADRLTVWQNALKGWNMKQSQVVLEWQKEARREGELAGQRAALLRAVRVRFKKKVPTKLSAAIAALNDADELARWLDAAVTADSLDEFRAAVQA